MASLRARSRLHPGPIEIINKVLSLSAFLVLMAAGWLALCYIKLGIESRSVSSPPASEAAAAQLPIQEKPAVQAPVKLVYSGAEDKVYYHNPNHILPSNDERPARSEEAARHLGLRPCPICIRQGGRSQSPVTIERRGASESAN